jgi:hypothetical protein
VICLDLTYIIALTGNVGRFGACWLGQQVQKCRCHGVREQFLRRGAKHVRDGARCADDDRCGLCGARSVARWGQWGVRVTLLVN